MSRSRKRKTNNPRRIERPATPHDDRSPPIPFWVYALVAACFLTGIGGGVLWRYRPRTPAAALPIAATSATGDSTLAAPAPASAPASAAATTDPQAPFQPPADRDERGRTEQKFRALFRRGYENFHAERYTAAADDFQQAVQVAPYLAEGHYYLGEVYRKLLLSDKAEQAYRDSLRQMSDFDPAKKSLCMLLHERGSYREANELLQTIPLTQANKSFVLGEGAINCLALGEYEQAAQLLQEYNSLVGRQGWGYAQLGRVKELQGNTDAALQLYHESLELDPHLTIAHHWQGLLLARLQRESESREAFARFDRLRQLQNQEHDLNMALLRRADDVPTLVRLAQVRRALGRDSEARATLQRASQLAPGNSQLRSLLQQWTNESGVPNRGKPPQ